MVFFQEYQTHLDQGAVTSSAWSIAVGAPMLLAVATKNGLISFFLEEGQALDSEQHLNASAHSLQSHHTQGTGVESDAGHGGLGVTITRVHKSDKKIDTTAPGTLRPSISMTSIEGEQLLAQGSSQTIPVKLAWHPKQHTLASGWDDGAICLWDEKQRQLKEDTSIHKAKITLLKWSPEGSRLITGDADGILAVWQMDSRSRLSPICQYRKKGAVTECAFRAPASHRLARTYSQEGLNNTVVACPSFFFGGEGGVLFFADDLGHCSQIVNVRAPIKNLFYSYMNDYIVVLTEDVVLYKYSISQHGKMTQERKVKLSIQGDGSHMQAVWAGEGLLAASNNEPRIRVWSLESDENYLLPLTNPRSPLSGDAKDTITALSFNPVKRLLTAGTKHGRVLLWRYVNQTTAVTDEASPSEDDWEALPFIDSVVRRSITKFTWAETNRQDSILCVEYDNKVSILAETVLHSSLNHGFSAIQSSIDRVVITTNSKRSKELKVGIRVKGVDISPGVAVVWNCRKVEVYKIEDTITLSSSFASRAKICRIHGENIFCAGNGRIEVCNYFGLVKKSFLFTDSEGQPTFMHVMNDFLVVLTSEGVVKLWNVAEEEAVLLLPGRTFAELDILKEVRVNANGTKIGILCHKVDDSGLIAPDSRLYVYDVDTDYVHHYEFGPHRYPYGIHWDNSEPRLLSTEARPFQVHAPRPAPESKEEVKDGTKLLREAEIVLMFASSEKEEGILMQDSFTLQTDTEGLLGIGIPYVYMSTRPANTRSGKGIPRCKPKTMRDFVGLESADADARRDLVNFNYYMTIGQIDEAYRAVKKIKSPAIWQNMAHMCVKTKRLDVAEICLGNMSNAKGVRAVQEAKRVVAEAIKSGRMTEEAGRDYVVAEVAIQLGKTKDAEKLLLEAHHYHRLVEMYQACGRWQDAQAVCQEHERIQLNSTTFQHAKFMEANGDISKAMSLYEAAHSHSMQIPRMLISCQRMHELEVYVQRTSDPGMLRWWAQYCEGNRRFEEALHFYRAAKDHTATVRILCYMKNFQKAADVCLETGDKAACYQLAKQYEAAENISEAIRFYTLAKRFNHGVRLARASDHDSELLTLALEGSKALKLDAASHFEAKGQYDKAVLLYQKGGNVNRALEISFQQELFDSLQSLAEDLGEDTDPRLLERCAHFFLDHNQLDKAAQLLVLAKEYEQAISLCHQNRIVLSPEMAEKLTPPKNPNATPEEKQARLDLLKQIARLCFQQGNFNVACKKFTQANEKVEAMKCLLKANDTDKIIYYAGKSRKREIFVMAANYLQTQDWHNKPQIMTHIAKFYTKAHAFEQLAKYFEVCSQVEIDEYRDYEKALSFLKESMKAIIKAKALQNRDSVLADIENRVRLVERFVDARQMVKHDADQMVQSCHQLLDQPNVDSVVRVGDVFALLIEFHYSQGQMDAAYQLVQRMLSSGIILEPYLDQAMVQNVYHALHVQFLPSIMTAGANAGYNEQQQGADDGQYAVPDDEIPDEIPEDFDDNDF